MKMLIINLFLINKLFSFTLSPLKRGIQTLHMKKTNSHSNSNIKLNNYMPKTPNQSKYIKSLKDSTIQLLFVVGPAGTGKTYMACSEAISLLKTGYIQKIILTRPVVAVEEEIGFLPGNLVQKMDPWTKPIMDVFEEKYTKQEINNLIQNNIIEIAPLAFMRGRTFKNAFVIADEMQNSSPNQMLMLTTRLGENCKMIITGDLKQTDKPNVSGLSDFIQKFISYRSKYIKNVLNSNITLFTNITENFTQNIGIDIIKLDVQDIQRSKVVSKILEIYDTEDKYEFKKVNNEIKKDINEIKKDINEIKKDNNKFTNSDAALIPKHLETKYYHEFILGSLH